MPDISVSTNYYLQNRPQFGQISSAQQMDITKISHRGEYTQKPTQVTAANSTTVKPVNNTLTTKEVWNNILLGGKNFANELAKKHKPTVENVLGSAIVVGTVVSAMSEFQSKSPLTRNMQSEIMPFVLGVYAASTAVKMVKTGVQASKSKTRKEKEEGWQNVGKQGLECLTAIGCLGVLTGITAIKAAKQLNKQLSVNKLSKEMINSAKQLGYSKKEALFIDTTLKSIENSAQGVRNVTEKELGRLSSLLGVKGADINNLTKQEYRKLILRFHPDRVQKNPFAEQIIKFVTEKGYRR